MHLSTSVDNKMNETIKIKAKEILRLGIADIIQNYTENALLINACFVSSKRYEALTNTSRLSTTQNIPAKLRLDQEIDYQFTNNELATKYKGDVPEVIFRNYVVISISLVDAILEDLYELFLTNLEQGIPDNEIEKKVRNAWTNDNIINYFIAENKVGLKKPTDMSTPFVESFMRYKELRIIRHSLLHSNGIIGQKNMNTLNEYLDNTPAERKCFAIVASPMIENGNRVTLSINTTLSIRQYLHRFLLYIYKSLNSA